jgi:hypothetical protein
MWFLIHISQLLNYTHIHRLSHLKSTPLNLKSSRSNKSFHPNLINIFSSKILQFKFHCRVNSYLTTIHIITTNTITIHIAISHTTTCHSNKCRTILLLNRMVAIRCILIRTTTNELINMVNLWITILTSPSHSNSNRNLTQGHIALVTGNKVTTSPPRANLNIL